MTRWVLTTVWLLASALAVGKDVAPLTLPKGARIGVVNMMDAEVTHFNTGRVVAQTFLKTHAVSWRVDSMLADTVSPMLGQLGLVAVPLAPTEPLVRGRDDFFVNHSVTKGLPRDCAKDFAALAAAAHVEALIVFAPALNNSAQADSGSRRGFPDYLRGWGFVTTTEGGKPTLFNVTQLLLIKVTDDTAVLQAREWGGNYSEEWAGYAPPPDLKQMPPAQLDELQPLFAHLLARQADPLLRSVHVSP